MSIQTQLFKGEDCALGLGCAIKFDKNTISQQFNTNSKYYLLDGSAVIQYDGESDQTLMSPYNSSWTGYVDPWDYNKTMVMNVLPSTQFLTISVTDQSNSFINFTSSVIKLENSNVTASMNSNSMVVIVGSNYTIDGNNYTDQKTRVILAKTPRETVVSTENSCSLVYIEPL